jgi:hypothetical protein
VPVEPVDPITPEEPVEPVLPAPVEPDPVEPDPIEAEPIEAEPVEPDPAPVEPVEVADDRTVERWCGLCGARVRLPADEDRCDLGHKLSPAHAKRRWWRPHR